MTKPIKLEVIFENNKPITNKDHLFRCFECEKLLPLKDAVVIVLESDTQSEILQTALECKECAKKVAKEEGYT